MSRPVGVTASAIVAILGSILALLFTALAIASLFIAPPQSQQANSAQSVIASAAMLAVLALIGMWTSVGLFRLRAWARTSILVFAGFLAACSIFTLVVMMIVPMPPNTTVGTEHTFRRTMAVVFGIPLAIAVWWLVQFNRQSTKAAFASSIADPASARPMSISVIAWMNIVGGASCLLPVVTGTPAFLFGVVFNGWIARVIYAVFAALTLYIGKGLLDLREEVRLLAIGWFAFTLVHLSLITLVPPLRQRMLDLQRTLVQNQPNPIAFDPGTLMNVMLVVAAIVAAGSIFFLIRNRAAFARAESA